MKASDIIVPWSIEWYSDRCFFVKTLRHSDGCFPWYYLEEVLERLSLIPESKRALCSWDLISRSEGRILQIRDGNTLGLTGPLLSCKSPDIVQGKQLEVKWKALDQMQVLQQTKTTVETNSFRYFRYTKMLRVWYFSSVKRLSLLWMVSILVL